MIEDNTIRPDRPYAFTVQRTVGRPGSVIRPAAGDLFRLMSTEQKDQLFDNIDAAMDGVPIEIVKRQLVHLYRADPDYGIGVATRMGLSVSDLPAVSAAAAE